MSDHVHIIIIKIIIQTQVLLVLCLHKHKFPIKEKKKEKAQVLQDVWTNFFQSTDDIATQHFCQSMKHFLPDTKCVENNVFLFHKQQIFGKYQIAGMLKA